jgi:phosphoglycolate phosphatase
MSQKVLIFDFDGTIADTFQLTVKICKLLADEFDYKRIGPEDIEPLKGMSSQDVIKYLHINPLTIPGILLRAREESAKGITSVATIAGLEPALHHLQSLGCEIGILTSNSEENVHAFLAKYNLDFFNFVKTSSKIWGKNHNLISLIRERSFSHENVTYIGDETRDIDAAKKAKIKSIAVTWGYNSRKILETHGPDHIIDTPKELLAICESF